MRALLNLSDQCRSLGVGLLCLLAPLAIAAQVVPNTPLLKGWSGTDLQEKIRYTYRPADVLSYAQARDTLFGLIDRRGDSLYCVYTGFGHYLAPDVDPTQFVFDNQGKDGLNCEHIYPQSMGARTGNARSDMHHLFPARIDVNQVRGNMPYGEVADWTTRRWYLLDYYQEHEPSLINRDLYSEWGSDFFEPRESVKGDVARAVFYFFTVYYDQADHPFFYRQLSTLLLWHLQDPPDALERARTWQIAHYQSGKPNPFVLDITLAPRAFAE